MSKANTKKNSTVSLTVLVVACAAVALVVSIGIQLLLSPDFSGFAREALSEPDVTYVPTDGTGAPEQGAKEEGAYDWRRHPVLIVGDSLTQGARGEIEKIVPGATIDAQVSRNMATGTQILEGWEDAGLIADDAILIVCLANNITGSTLQEAQDVVDMIRPGQSLILMTGHGRSNMDAVNELIRSFPTKYSYVTVADWDRTISQNTGLLGEDGIHINGSRGNALYADLIVSALEVAQPKP